MKQEVRYIIRKFDFNAWEYVGQDGTTMRFRPGTADWNPTKSFPAFAEAYSYAESSISPPWRVIESTHMGPGKTWKEVTLAAAT